MTFPSLFASVLMLAIYSVLADNTTCAYDESNPGPWGQLLEEWALTAPAHGERQGRIMSLPPAQGYYVTDRVDRPPPLPHPHRHPTGPHASHAQQMPHSLHAPQMPHASQAQPYPPGPVAYDEWKGAPAAPDSKIVNRPPSPNKDKFKPSYQSPPANQHIPAHHPPPPLRPSAVDRIGEAATAPPPQPPRKQVSETDLYLLSAMEKLVWRADLMEKRLRKLEESVHYLVVGQETKPDPCVADFTRVGAACYHVSEAAADWKSANLHCRKLRANLLELDTETERRTVASALLADKRLRGVDFWTGGLNPGLLWIWAHSARPVGPDPAPGNATATGSPGNSTLTVVGDGRCLALVHDAATASYVYRGIDCGWRHRFICEKEEDKAKLSNEIERVARAMRGVRGGARAGRESKVMWADEVAL